MKCGKCNFENSPNSLFCGRCGTRIDIAPGVNATTITYHSPQSELGIGGTFAERYQVIEELGKGGMGKVYKVLDREINETIALKLLRPEISADEKVIERFRNELKLARKITHENVCRMYDLAKYEGAYFITMEHISGEDLKSTISRFSQLNQGKTLSIAKQVCHGLAAAHRLGVVHRDLKPHNIMIDRQGHVRIMDFGIARSVAATGITESGVLIGTPEYMSPEQAMGEYVDQRSDIYSLGVILFELVTGMVPFKGETPVSVALKHKTELPPNPKKICPAISEDLSRLILRCLEKDKNKRFQNVDELLAEISDIDRGLPTADRLISEKPRQDQISGRRSRRRLSAILGVILIAVLALIAGFFLVQSILQKDVSRLSVLSIKSNPAGAEILLDGEFTGKTPDEFELLPGTHKLALRLAQYKTLEEKIKIGESEKIARDYVLEPLASLGTLQLRSIPTGAEVYIDNDRQAEKTPLEIKLQSGTHKLRLKHPQFQEKSDEIKINPGEITVREYQLSATYFLSLTSEPDGAKISIDGKWLGTTPLENIELANSLCRVMLEKGGGWRVEKNLTLQPGMINKEHLKLEKKMYEFSLRTNPQGALVYMGEKQLGVTPFNKNLPLGTYDLRIEKEGYEPTELSIVLKPDTQPQVIDLKKLEEVQITISANRRANIYLDDKPIGEAPFKKIMTVTIGWHKIRFESDVLNQIKEHSFLVPANHNVELQIFVDTGTFVTKNIKIN